MNTTTPPRPPRIETTEDLEQIVDAQNTTIKGLAELVKGLGEMVKGQHARIQLLTALIDNHHDVLIAHGLAKPREGNGLAN